MGLKSSIFPYIFMNDLAQFKVVFLAKYKNLGHNEFYKYLITYCIKKIVLIQDEDYKGILPHLQMLTYYNNALTLYRRDGDDSLLEMSKLFRKVGHKIYRMLLKKQLIVPDNKFLTEV